MNKPIESEHSQETLRLTSDQIDEAIANVIDTKSVSMEVRVLLGEGREYSASEILEIVQDVLIDALGLNDDEPHLSAEINADLGAESLDHLDIAYRLEKAFRIKIPRGDIFIELKQNTTAEGQEGDEYEPMTVRNIVEYIMSRSKIKVTQQ